ncbi:hypothetical protein C8J57DRAFT_999621, partial [Mycena rebaudengoi]
TKFVSADEKLAAFLYFSRTGCTSCMLQGRFQCSADTIHKWVVHHQYRSVDTILHMLVGSFYQKHVHLPPDEMPMEIKQNSKVYPYFCNARGAIDGSQFHAW